MEDLLIEIEGGLGPAKLNYRGKIARGRRGVEMKEFAQWGFSGPYLFCAYSNV
jgi:hypothetical protein